MPMKRDRPNSAQAFVLEKLVDADRPMSSLELAEGRPEGMALKSPGVAAGQLFVMGVLGSNQINKMGTGGRAYAYFVKPDGLDHLPPDFAWAGKPESYNDSPKCRTKISAPSATAGVHDGEITLTTEHPEPHPPPVIEYEAPRRDTMMSPEVGPGVVLVFNGKRKWFSAKDAKELYRQLREIYE